MSLCDLDRNSILVIGSGPAGLLYGAYQHIFNKKYVTVVTNNWKWHCTYCVWESEIKNSWLYDIMGDRLFAHIWPEMQFITVDGDKKKIKDKYCLINNDEVQNKLLSYIDRIIYGNVSFFDTTKVVTDGEIIYADNIINATGLFNPLLVKWQSFVGHWVKVERNKFNATLMDWSQNNDSDGFPASFLYILPVEDECLLEETVLIDDNKVPLDILEKRLQTRKKKLGVDDATIIRVEKYAIPMGGPYVVSKSSIGASAYMSHPATGYMFGYLVNFIAGEYQETRLLRYLNNFGSYVLSKNSRDKKFTSEFLNQMLFSTPHWKSFMTRNISFGKYIYNLMHFAKSYQQKKKLIILLLRYIFQTCLTWPRICNV